MMSLPSRPPLESKDSSFDDPLTINPWKVLVDNICENLDKELYTKFLFHSKELVLDDYNALEKNGERDEYRQYFSKLEDNLGENGAVDHLEHLVRHLGLHGGMGEINYTEWISSYKEAKKEYIRKCESVLKIDPDFVGRELILEDTLKNFRAFKGVTLCGISGMGKTSLAAQVCARLACSKPKWRIIILNQREKSELNDLLLDMISELSAELDGNEYMQLLSETNTNHLKVKCNKLIDEVLEKQLNILLLLDNVDGHCDGEDRQHDFSQFMKELLNNIPLKSSVKFLMTVGRKLSTTRLSNERNFVFNGQMLEQELKPFTEFETSRALRRISEKSEKELSDRVCSDIHALCGGIPFSVRVVGDLLKNGFTPEKLLSGLQRQPQSVPMDMFLQKSFQMLESTPSMNELKNLLVRFSVFQTARFNISAAVAVGFNTSRDEEFRRPLSLSSFSGMTIRDETVKNEMELKLQQLKCHFLLEIDDAQSSLGRKRTSGEKLFSLHPLVANYVMSLCKEDENLRMERESARSQFLQYYGTVIETLGKRCDSDPLISRNMIEASMIHIKQFFTIIREEKTLLTQYLPQKDPNKHKRSAKVAVQRRHIWKIAEWAISSCERKLFARRQAELEHDRKNLFSYIYWRSLEAESLLIQDRIQLTLELLDNVTSELGIVTDDTVCSKVDGWIKVPDEEMITWATFYTVKGRLYFKKSRNNNEKVLQERAMNILTLAENLLEGKDKSCKGEDLKKYFQIDLADVKNLKGCVYFLTKEYNKSQNCHETAYNLVLKLTGNQLHKNLTEYRSNVASCLHQSALDANDPIQRDVLFQKALQYYDMSVRNNKQIKCEMMPSQAGTLRNRAEIYYKQNRLENALEDGKHVLKIVRSLYVAPHIEITLAIERLAHYHFKLGKKKQKDLDEEGQTHLEKAMEFYDEVLMHITNGGLPLENNDARTYRHVRDNHMKVMRLLRYEGRLVENRLRQYQGFEEGKYSKKIHHNLQHDLDFVPEEFLKKAIAEGAKFVPHKMEDSDDESSESSCSEASHVSSSSSSKSSSERALSPNRMMDVDQVIALKRQDSGLEEAEMSDEEVEDPQKELTDMEVDKRDVKPSIVDAASKRESFGKRSSGHVSSELPGVLEVDEGKGEIQMIELREPSLSRSFDSGRESCTSSLSASSFDSRRKSSLSYEDSRRVSRLSSSFEIRKRLDTWSSTGSEDCVFSGVPKKRERFSHSGSQDSVTFQIDRMLCLSDEEKDDDDETGAKSSKRKKTENS